MNRKVLVVMKLAGFTTWEGAYAKHTHTHTDSQIRYLFIIFPAIWVIHVEKNFPYIKATVPLIVEV